MKKSTIGIIATIIIAIVIIAIVVAIFVGGKKENNPTTTAKKMQTVEEMKQTLNDIYTKLGEKLPNLEINEVDVSDESAVTFATGLKSKENVEAVVISEPFMSSQAYSAVIVKTSENADIEQMKQDMINNIDTRKWICVTAEKVYVTNYENIIFLVMSSDEWAKPVYDEFKNAVDGKIGKELQKTEEI